MSEELFNRPGGNSKTWEFKNEKPVLLRRGELVLVGEFHHRNDSLLT